MKKSIITDLNFLRQKSLDVTKDEAKEIIQDLEDSLDLNKGLGLSAIQIGIAKNISIIRYGDVKIDLINAYIDGKDNKFRMKCEGCLSLPGLYIDTTRYDEILIYNNGKREEYSGIIAIAVQHEVDHCNGLTILDRKWRAR